MKYHGIISYHLILIEFLLFGILSFIFIGKYIPIYWLVLSIHPNEFFLMKIFRNSTLIFFLITMKKEMLNQFQVYFMG